MFEFMGDISCLSPRLEPVDPRYGCLRRVAVFVLIAKPLQVGIGGDGETRFRSDGKGGAGIGACVGGGVDLEGCGGGGRVRVQLNVALGQVPEQLVEF